MAWSDKGLVINSKYKGLAYISRPDPSAMKLAFEDPNHVIHF
jgi:hypothetical protein